MPMYATETACVDAGKTVGSCSDSTAKSEVACLALSPAGSWTAGVTWTAAVRQHTAHGLSPGVHYFFKVKAYNEFGEAAAWSTASCGLRTHTAPDQVTGLAATRPLRLYPFRGLPRRLQGRLPVEGRCTFLPRILQ